MGFPEPRIELSQRNISEHDRCNLKVVPVGIARVCT